MGDAITLLSFSDGGWGTVLVLATGMTIALAVCCTPLGLCLGLVSALMIRSKSRAMRTIATFFSSIFRSLPELLTLFLVYHGLQSLLTALTNFFGYGGRIEINAFFAGVLALGVVCAAFSCEVWLGAFNTIDRGQYEAAHALSLSRIKTFWAVIFPQLLRNALPGLSNNWMNLLKDTSLVSVISLVDIIRQSQLAVAATKQPLLFYTVACLIYLVLAALSDLMLKRLERHTRRFERKAAG